MKHPNVKKVLRRYIDTLDKKAAPCEIRLVKNPRVLAESSPGDLSPPLGIYKPSPPIADAKAFSLNFSFLDMALRTDRSMLDEHVMM